jgi:methionine--tRNA ligase beta chain
MINLEDFQKLDLRVARITKAESVPGSDKLLRLELDSGEEDLRQVVSGIAKSYVPKNLIGKEIVIINNLEPRQILGLESQGMLLAVDQGDQTVLLVPDQAAAPGSKIR